MHFPDIYKANSHSSARTDYSVSPLCSSVTKPINISLRRFYCRHPGERAHYFVANKFLVCIAQLVCLCNSSLFSHFCWKLRNDVNDQNDNHEQNNLPQTQPILSCSSSMVIDQTYLSCTRRISNSKRSFTNFKSTLKLVRTDHHASEMSHTETATRWCPTNEQWRLQESII